MAQVKIVTDSTARLTAEEIAELGVTVIPLSIMVDGKVYQDGVTITPSEFMVKMAAAAELPTTSQPALGVFTEAYEAFDEDTEILSIHLTENLSGTVHAAEQAADMVPQHVRVVDSHFIDRALAFQVVVAARLANQGATMDEIIDAVKRVEENTELYLTVSTLQNLVSGGRLSKTSGLIGALLNIKLGAHVQNGNINVEVKGRGQKTIKAYHEKVFEEMADVPTGIAMVGISHADAEAEANALADRVRELYPDAEVNVSETTPIVSTHTGAGAIGFSYLKKH
jgi:DegV family protein with EDD domain